jgi:pimeloyl-ACP methyl ester carboxylesterase
MRHSSLLVVAGLVAAALLANYWFTRPKEYPPIHYEWTESERGSIRPADCDHAFPNARWLTLPLDPQHPEQGTFQQFYFIQDATDLKQPMVLNISGGLGGIPGPHAAWAPKPEGGGVVYFHIRGAGCSQIPADNSFDRFIRARYVIDDIEAIRSALGVQSWAAVHGESAATMLAQMYAHEHPDQAARLILHAVVNPGAGREQTYLDAIAGNLVEIVKQDRMGLFTWMSEGNRSDLSLYFRADLTDLSQLGSIHEVLTDKRYLHADGSRPSLAKGKAYLMAIHTLAYYGWAPVSSDVRSLQNYSALVIAHAFFNVRMDELGKALAVLEKLADDQFGAGAGADASRLPDFSDRVFTVTRVYDGESASVIKFLQLGHSVSDYLNRYQQKVGLAGDARMSMYSPNEFRHSVPTFVTQGGADAVTPAVGAIDYLTSGLAGRKILVIANGAGHELPLGANCRSAIYPKLFSGDWFGISKLFDSGGPCFSETGVKVLE